jgi:hypothetical protein
VELEARKKVTKAGLQPRGQRIHEHFGVLGTLLLNVTHLPLASSGLISKSAVRSACPWFVVQTFDAEDNEHEGRAIDLLGAR